ncbi:MAG: GNAT family N-acetyltransferase [Solirubrobacterales bacterium]
MSMRTATRADLDGLTATLTAAFERDPIWSWAYPDPADLAVWWRFYLSSALRYSRVWLVDDFAAVSVWIPPNGTELTDAEEQQIGPLVARLAGHRAPEIMELLARFEASHPADADPHYYLTLLGTHPDSRGRGLGMGLLAANLSDVDAEGLPAYLESTNPDNNARYERLGFRQVGEFTTPDGSRPVTTMWREPARPEKFAVIEAAYEALATRGLDRFLEHWTEDLDHRAIEGALDDRGPLHGRAAMRAYLLDWIDTFDEFRIELVELIDGGDDIVVAVLRFGGRAKLSGVEADSTFGVVFRIRDGEIAWGREYATRQQALEAAGLDVG